MNTPEDKILLAHGSGGRLSHELVESVFLPYFGNPALDLLEDCSPCPARTGQLVMTTDSYVVDPVFFPGGDIGRLAVCGTVNDLAMSGARPAFLTAGFILEEGFPLSLLHRILQSMQEAAAEAGVEIVAGDTKVVPRGKADRIFINTSGTGFLQGIPCGARRVEPEDAILINGFLGDHGTAVMAARENLHLPAAIRSDCAPLNGLVQSMLDNGLNIHAMRDPTRGGLATTLNEIARTAGLSLEIEESSLPVREEVQSACEILGFDPLYLANEGKLVIFLPEAEADRALEIMRRHTAGVHAKRIGTAGRRGRPQVTVRTVIGGRRILDMLTGEQLPRIC